MSIPEGGFTSCYRQNLESEARKNCGFGANCGLERVQVSTIVDREGEQVYEVFPSMECVDNCPFRDESTFDQLHQRAAAKTLAALGLTDIIFPL